MDRSQIAGRLAGRMELSKPLAAGAVDAVFATIREALAGATTVSFPYPASRQGSAVLLSPLASDRVTLKEQAVRKPSDRA